MANKPNLFVVTVTWSDGDPIFQKVFTKKCDARKEFNAQVKESRENYKAMERYEYTSTESSNFKVVQGFNAHTAVYLHEYTI